MEKPPFKNYLDADFFKNLDPFTGAFRTDSIGAMKNDDNTKFEQERYNFIQALRCCLKGLPCDTVASYKEEIMSSLEERGYIQKAWVVTFKGEQALKKVIKNGRTILLPETIRPNKALRENINYLIDTGCDKDILIEDYFEDDSISDKVPLEKLVRELEAMIEEGEVIVKEDGSLR